LKICLFFAFLAFFRGHYLFCCLNGQAEGVVQAGDEISVDRGAGGGVVFATEPPIFATKRSSSDNPKRFCEPSCLKRLVDQLSET
jgi:hypothetical protein